MNKSIAALLIFVLMLLTRPLRAQDYQVGQRSSFVASSSNPSVVQFKLSPGAFTTNPSSTIAFTTSITSGNIAVIFAGSNSNTSWNTPSGCGLTFTAARTPTTGSDAMGLWTAPIGSTGSCTATISSNNSSASTVFGVGYEVANATTSGLVASAYNVTSGCTSCTGAGLTSTASNSLILTFMANGAMVTMSAPSPFTFDINTQNSIGDTLGAGHYLLATAGSYTPTWTASTPSNFDNVSIALAP